MNASVTARVGSCLDRLRAGDKSAHDDLLVCASERLRHLAHQMLRGYGRVRRWEETDDVLANATVRLHRALANATPESPLHFFRLAALQIRRELKDLARKHFGPEGIGARHDTVLNGSQHPQLDQAVTPEEGRSLEMWTELHDRVELLENEEKEVFELLWYHQLTQGDAADVLQISRRTVIRRWQSACLKLHQQLFSVDSVSHNR